MLNIPIIDQDAADACRIKAAMCNFDTTNQNTSDAKEGCCTRDCSEGRTCPARARKNQRRITTRLVDAWYYLRAGMSIRNALTRAFK